MRRCRITVLKCCFDEALAKEYVHDENYGLCPVFKEGDEFLTSGPFGSFKPEKFCSMAWKAIELQATSLASGGKVFGYEDVNIACCNDGIRPVIFKLEAVDDGV